MTCERGKSPVDFNTGISASSVATEKFSEVLLYFIEVDALIRFPAKLLVNISLIRLRF